MNSHFREKDSSHQIHKGLEWDNLKAVTREHPKMNFMKREWLAAIPYLLTLILIINVHVIGLHDFSIIGINISIYSLVPLLGYYLLVMGNRDHFVQHHMINSMGNLFVYLVLSSLYSGVMFMLGYRVGVIDAELLAAANFNTWIAIAPLIAILVHTTLSSVHGTSLALKQLYPNGAQQSES